MSNHKPNNWVVIKMDGDDPHYRVLAGWSGGYLDGDSWKMNSGITRVEDDGDCYNFYGSSGSCYSCYKESYCIRMTMLIFGHNYKNYTATKFRCWMKKRIG